MHVRSGSRRQAREMSKTRPEESKQVEDFEEEGEGALIRVMRVKASQGLQRERRRERAWARVQPGGVTGGLAAMGGGEDDALEGEEEALEGDALEAFLDFGALLVTEAALRFLGGILDEKEEGRDGGEEGLSARRRRGAQRERGVLLWSLWNVSTLCGCMFMIRPKVVGLL